MGGLHDHLRRRIALDGPLGVDAYMREALTHPDFGYYMGRDPLGRAGDFVTAPEISQMFGELVGLWCAAAWQGMGMPDPVRVVELGPGRGTLMADFLRAAAKIPGFAPAIDLHLVEASPALRDKQRAALGETPVAWHDSIAGLPDGPALIVANEFFDALPIRQFERRDGAWHERLVDADPESGELRFVLSPATAVPPGLPERLDGAADGEIFEARPAGLAVATALGERLAAFGGAALIVDYGHAESGLGDTLQAVKGHAYHPVLDDPGSADLTAHVDFELLGRCLTEGGARVFGAVEQGAFLRALGIESRAGALLQQATARQAADIESALHRLVAPEAMGRLFKVLAATGPGQPVPPPFEA